MSRRAIPDARLDRAAALRAGGGLGPAFPGGTPVIHMGKMPMLR